MATACIGRSRLPLLQNKNVESYDQTFESICFLIARGTPVAFRSVGLWVGLGNLLLLGSWRRGAARRGVPVSLTHRLPIRTGQDIFISQELEIGASGDRTLTGLQGGRLQGGASTACLAALLFCFRAPKDNSYLGVRWSVGLQLQLWSGRVGLSPVSLRPQAHQVPSPQRSSCSSRCGVVALSITT